MNTTIPEKTKVATFDIDPQNTFTPICPEELPVPGGTEIVSELNTMAGYGAVRIGSKDAHCAEAIWVANDKQPQFSPVDGDNVDIRWNAHAVPGTKGFELIAGLPQPNEYDFFVWKGIELDMHPYGACYHDLGDQMSTGVIEMLKVQGIETVICGGLATDYCVATTVKQLLKAGLDVVVNLAACRGIAKDTTETAVQDMITAGARIVEQANQLEQYA